MHILRPHPIYFRFDSEGNIREVSYPRYAFRYVWLGDAVFENLKTGRLWFSHPTAFNDPFDGQSIMDYECSEEELAQYFDTYFPKVMRDKIDLRDLVKRAHEQPQVLQQVLNAVQAIKISEVHICCFSEVNNHPLMWGHYADGHRGICLVFDLHELTRSGQFAMTPVIYTADRPKWNQIRERNTYKNSDLFQHRFQTALLATKGDQWSYEREIRLISHNPGLNAFPRTAFEGVILGARVSEKDANALEDVLRAVYPGYRVGRVKLDTNTGEIAINDFQQYYQQFPITGGRLLESRLGASPGIQPQT